MNNSDDLMNAIIRNESINVPYGITYTELVANTKFHNQVFYDKWGIPWKYENNTLYYSEEGYKPKKKRLSWSEAYMGGKDLTYKKFFTFEQFQTIKPPYL